MHFIQVVKNLISLTERNAGAFLEALHEFNYLRMNEIKNTISIKNLNLECKIWIRMASFTHDITV